MADQGKVGETTYTVARSRQFIPRGGFVQRLLLFICVCLDMMLGSRSVDHCDCYEDQGEAVKKRCGRS